jgi:poly-beta-1,6-N-acetyl-D-glucosamine synthase
LKISGYNKFLYGKPLMAAMEVSIGVMTFNEGKNISRLLGSLLGQKTTSCRIKEIIVVDGGSTDGTATIASSFKGKVKVIRCKKREGKFASINRFLEAASSNILVLASADTLPSEHSIEHLCQPLRNPRIGIVAGRPIPLNSKGTLLGSVIHLQHKIHHNISEQHPKFCDLIAFRKMFGVLPPTAVDEEQIGAIVLESGYRTVYAKSAVFYNMGAKNLREHLLQRRRIHCGHLTLKRMTGYASSSLRPLFLMKALWKESSLGNVLPMLCAITIEAYARVLGRMDADRKLDYCMWEPAPSTKYLPVHERRQELAKSAG